MANKKVATKEDFEKCKEAVLRAKKNQFTIDDFLAELFDDLCELRYGFKMSIIEIAKLLADNGAPAVPGTIKPLLSKLFQECEENKSSETDDKKDGKKAGETKKETGKDKSDDKTGKTGEKLEAKTNNGKTTTQQIAEKYKGKKSDGGDKDLVGPDFDNL